MAFTNVGSAEGEYALVSVLSQTLTVAVPDLAANSIGVVAVCIHVSTALVTGVTWDGAAMTLAESALNADENRKVYLFYKVNPADDGNKDVVVSFNVAAVTFHIVAAWADAGAAVILDDTSTETGSAQNPDIVSTQAGANELVISASATDNNGPVNAPTGCTQLQGYDSGANCSESCYSIEGSSGNATHTHNYNQAVSSAYAIASASFKEAGGAYTLPADSGSFSLTTQPADLRAIRQLPAAAAGFSLTGQVAGLRAARKLAAAVSELLLTGQAAGLIAARKVAADSGSFAFTGIDASLVYTAAGAYTLPAGTGALMLSGQAIGLYSSRRLVANAGAFILTGVDATLTYTPVGGYSLPAAAASFILAGQDLLLRVARKIASDVAAFGLAGQDAGLYFGRRLPAGAGAFAFTGQAVGFVCLRVIAAGRGIFILTFWPVTFTYSGAFVFGRVLIASVVSLVPRRTSQWLVPVNTTRSLVPVYTVRLV